MTLTPVTGSNRVEEVEIVDDYDTIDNDVEVSEIKKYNCIFCPDDDGSCNCGKCEDCESMMTTLGMNIHIINEHEPNMVYQHFGRDWVMDHRNWISGTYSPIWKQTWKDLNVSEQFML